MVPLPSLEPSLLALVIEIQDPMLLDKPYPTCLIPALLYTNANTPKTPVTVVIDIGNRNFPLRPE